MKHQIEQVIPYEIEEEKVTKANSPIITTAVLNTANKAGGEDKTACVVFCLLIVKKWFAVWECLMSTPWIVLTLAETSLG